jgi:hypothetical protein
VAAQVEHDGAEAGAGDGGADAGIDPVEARIGEEAVQHHHGAAFAFDAIGEAGAVEALEFGCCHTGLGIGD